MVFGDVGGATELSQALPVHDCPGGALVSVCRCSIQVALRSLIAAVLPLLRSTMSLVLVDYE